MDITPNKQMIKPTHQGSAHSESLMHLLGGIHQVSKEIVEEEQENFTGNS